MASMTFLHYVAKDLIQRFGNDLSRVTVVFPNKRASLFLNRHLAELSDKPVWSPNYTTISELFRNESDLVIVDPILAICHLHQVMTEMQATSFTLDQFYGWGKMLVSDFDDIDKNMAPVDSVFQNVSDLHEMDSTDFLTDEQKAAVRQFFSNFTDSTDSTLRNRFLQLWNRLDSIYHTFRQRLRSEGLAYEGMMYRDVAEAAEQMQALHSDQTFAFVGFNMVQTSERILFRALQSEDKALFYWDMDDYYRSATDNEAGHYIRRMLKEFPSALDLTDKDIYHQFAHPRNITYISAPTETMQARYVTTWLREQNRLSEGVKTAIVLADESLLPSVLRSLPPEVKKVNITTGYPLAQTQAAVLLSLLMQLHTLGRTDHGFRLRYVCQILRHPYIISSCPEAAELNRNLNRSKRMFPTSEALSCSPLLSLIFCQQPEHTNEHEALLWCINWLNDIISAIAQTNTASNSTPLTRESLFRSHLVLNRISSILESGMLTLNISTLFGLIREIVSTTSVPFHGEPAEGIQIMGMLETRNLDFDHVLLLSANEGNLPRGINDASLIPYSIRNAYGLTTSDHKVAIYAYYFYHLLQRCGDISIAFSNATTKQGVKERSRFMSQLMVESPHTINHIALNAGRKTSQTSQQPITKTPEVMERLVAHYSTDQRPSALLTPSAINNYLNCPAKFYYRHVLGLYEDEDVNDDFDQRSFGKVMHKTAELLYQSLGGKSQSADGKKATYINVTEADIRNLQDDRKIDESLDKAFALEFFNMDPNNLHRPNYNGLQIINKSVIKRYVKQLLDYDLRHAPFTIIDTEDKHTMPFTINVPGQPPLHTNVGGTIDRLDIIKAADGVPIIRILDYKTGKPDTKQLFANLFSVDAYNHHLGYALQTLLYCYSVQHEFSNHPDYSDMRIVPALFYVREANDSAYEPQLELDKQPITDSRTLRDSYMDGLQQLLQQIFSPDIPFHHTSDSNRCTFCPYTQLCGKT